MPPNPAVQPQRGEHRGERSSGDQDREPQQTWRLPDPVEREDQQEGEKQPENARQHRFRDLCPPEPAAEGIELPAQRFRHWNFNRRFRVFGHGFRQ